MSVQAGLALSEENPAREMIGIPALPDGYRVTESPFRSTLYPTAHHGVMFPNSADQEVLCLRQGRVGGDRLRRCVGRIRESCRRKGQHPAASAPELRNSASGIAKCPAKGPYCGYDDSKVAARSDTCRPLGIQQDGAVHNPPWTVIGFSCPLGKQTLSKPPRGLGSWSTGNGSTGPIAHR